MVRGSRFAVRGSSPRFAVRSSRFAVAVAFAVRGLRGWRLASWKLEAGNWKLTNIRSNAHPRHRRHRLSRRRHRARAGATRARTDRLRATRVDLRPARARRRRRHPRPARRAPGRRRRRRDHSLGGARQPLAAQSPSIFDEINVGGLEADARCSENARHSAGSSTRRRFSRCRRRARPVRFRRTITSERKRGRVQVARAASAAGAASRHARSGRASTVLAPRPKAIWSVA